MIRRKVLVTGASGFIGQHFVKNADGFDITEVDLLKQNVDDIDFSDIDSVLHLAAYVHQMKGGDTDTYFEVNRDLAFEVAKKAKMQNVKHFVLMSTVKVYGEATKKDQPWSEKSPCFPQDPYGKSKLEAEKLITSLVDEKFKLAIIRSPLVYGPGVKANMFNLIKLIDKYPVLPLGGINNARTMVYIENLVELIRCVINTQQNGIFLPSDREALSTTKLVRIIARNLDKNNIKMINIAYLHKMIQIFIPRWSMRLFGSLELNNKYTFEKLSYYPPFTIEQGIKEMVKWFKQEFK